MKKSLLTLVPALAIIAISATSCADKCCTLLTAKVCESDLPAGYADWDAYAASLETAGYSCD
jgi:hypothetical protein